MNTAVGYSKTPLYKKLGIKAGDRAWFSGAPEGYELELRPAGAFERVQRLDSDLDFLHFFVSSNSDLEKQFPKLRDAMKLNASLWISWPKKASGVQSDLDENIVRQLGLQVGLVDVKVCAVTEVWSGLKFVFRLRDRF